MGLDRVGMGPRLLMSNMLCSIAIRTDGKQLLEIAIVPLTGTYERNEIAMFYVRLKPTWPVGPKAKLTIAQIAMHEDTGIDPIDAIDMFEHWIKRVGLKDGKKMYPMAWSWSAIAPLIQEWLGESLFKERFINESRDLSTIMGYLSDRYECHAEPGIFNPMNYRGMLKVFRMKLESPFDPLEQARQNAVLYKKTLRVYFPSFKDDVILQSRADLLVQGNSDTLGMWPQIQTDDKDN